MQTIGTLLCAAAAAGAAIAAPAAASAAPAQCVSTNDNSMTVVDGRTACGSEADGTGRAAAYGDDGVGYAKAISGASAVGVGLAGGVGASQGEGGVPAAFGLGPDSVAITSVKDGTLSLAVAFAGSQALVADSGDRVVCEGSSAFAWNARTGEMCAVTGLGDFRIG